MTLPPRDLEQVVQSDLALVERKYAVAVSPRFALMPAMLPALWFEMKISPNEPSAKREMVAVNLRPS